MLRDWSLAACSAVNLYLLGVMVVFAVVVYPPFAAVDRSAFSPLYKAFNGSIGLAVVPWEFIALITTLVLYGARAQSVPLWVVHALTALGVAYFVITFGWHLPAHRALAAGDNSAQALAPLLSSQWARTIVQVVRAGLLVWVGTVRT